MSLTKLRGARGFVPLIALLSLGIGLAGCEGDDGRDGAQGPQGPGGSDGGAGPTGPTGPTGPSASLKPLESCAVCHDDASVASATVAHAENLPALTTVTNLVFQAAGPDLVVTYNLKVDGQNASGFLSMGSDYRSTAGITSDAGANAPTGGGSGDYSITIPDGVASAGAASRYFFRVSDGTTAAVVSGDYPAPAFTDAVTDQSCNNCHGPTGIAAHTSFGYPGMTASQCVVCHKAEGGLPFLSFEDSWVGLIHGIHGSHDRPSGSYIYGTEEFEVTYPTYMSNCSVCHADPAILTSAVNTMPVSGTGCFTCHESMESWEEEFAASGATFHNVFDETTDCTSCHNSGANAAAPGLVEVADFHNGIVTERGGIIWDGVDTSVVEGDKFTWQITNIGDDGTNLAISWTATYEGDPVNPCNATVGASAPVFHAASGGNLSMLRNYFQGDDPILGPNVDQPGQPSNAVNLTTTNTTCAGNVATTTIPVEASVTTGRGLLALQGKPRVVSAANASALMAVRVPTPTREWVVGTGAQPAQERRAIADTGECLKCHVGSLYQHGGNRVDNVSMCVACHHSASNEQNVRVGMGVEASEAYDGKAGQTYEFKSMLHAVHTAGIDGQSPIVIYRNRGIYAWATDEALLPNWSSLVPCEKATPTAGQEYRVFGGDPALDVSCQPHTFYSPTYPRAPNDCAACHTSPNFAVMPDQAKAMATTLTAGAAPWNNQLDDVLQGATSAACTSCHQSSATRGHSNQNGWTPQVFPAGRQTIIDAAGN